MGRKYLFEPDVYSVTTLDEYSSRWPHLKPRELKLREDEGVIESILGAHQYFDFHLMMLERIRHAHTEKDLPPLELHFTIRAGMVKSAIIAGVSVIEGVLLFLGHSRRLPLDNRSTFGSTLKAWNRVPRHRKEIAPINNDLKRLMKVRNRIHLYAETGINWEHVLTHEVADLNRVHACVDFLQGVRTRDRRLPGRVNSFHRSKPTRLIENNPAGDGNR